MSNQDILAGLIVILIVGALMGALLYEYFVTAPLRRRLNSDRTRLVKHLARQQQHLGTPYIQNRRIW